MAFDATGFNMFALLPGFISLLKDGWVSQKVAITAEKLRFRDFRLWQFVRRLVRLFGSSSCNPNKKK